MNGPIAAAIAIWLGLQVVALGISANRVMLWANSPRAAERLGLAVMLAIQIAAASLLFPFLLQNRRSTIIALATACPFSQLAAFLADTGLHQWIVAELYVSLWLVALHLWAIVLRNSWTAIFAAAMAAMLTIGGPILAYLRGEFSSGGQMATVTLSNYGPIPGAISLIFPNPSFTPWMIPVLLLASGAIICFAQRDSHSKIRDTLST